MGRLAASLQVGVEVAGDAAGEEHLARSVALATDADAALGPVDVLDVDGQGFAAAQAAVVDEPEQGAVARVADAPQHCLDLRRVQHARVSAHLGPALQSDERIVLHIADAFHMVL